MGHVGVAVSWLVGLIFLAAAIGKAVAPLRFGAVVAHVLGNFDSTGITTGPVTLGLIALESLIGMLYLLLLAGQRTHRWTIALLVGFICLLVTMWFRPPAKGCGCVTFWTVPSDPSAELMLGVVRNTGLIVCVSALWNSTRQPTHTRNVHRGASPTQSVGFTLIETLVLISVMVVVLAIALPSMMGAKQTARRSTELADAVQIHVALTSYSSDHKDFFPFCATPGKPNGPLTFLTGEVQGQYAFLTGQSRLYINLLSTAYLANVSHLTSDGVSSESPNGLPLGVVRSDVWLTYTAFTHPNYWIGANEPSNLNLLTGARWSDIVYPSDKGVLVDARSHNRKLLGQEPTSDTRFSWGIVNADGSALRRMVNLDIPYRTVERPMAMFNWPVLSTEFGLAGRDFVERPATP